MTPAQRRLVAAIRAAEPCAEYWPIVNDWVKDAGPTQALAHRNITRTVDALVRAKVITITDDGCFQLLRR